MVLFDFRKFLADTVLTPQGAIKLFRGYGFTPPEKSAAQKWFLRGKAPGSWLALMLALLELEAGKPLSLAQYIKLGDDRASAE